MATKPVLRRAVAGQKSKASDYNWNFDQMIDYLDNSVIELNEEITNNSNNVDELKDYVYNIGVPIITLESVLNENEIWLEGAEVSKTDYQNLYTIYGDTYGVATDSNNFNYLILGIGLYGVQTVLDIFLKVCLILQVEFGISEEVTAYQQHMVQFGMMQPVPMVQVAPGHSIVKISILMPQ